MNKKEKIKISIWVSLFFLFFIMLCVTLYSYVKENSILILDDNIASVIGVVETENKINYSVLEIEGQKYESVISGEISIYDFMNDFRRKGVIDFTEKDYTGMGKFVESINGIKRDRNHSWIFYVNNKKSGLGVSNYKIKSGDVVSWKYEKNY